DGLDEARMRRVLPSLFAALDAMRAIDLSAASGFGGWRADGTTPRATWRAHLLGVATHPGTRGAPPSRELLEASPTGTGPFREGAPRPGDRTDLAGGSVLAHPAVDVSRIGDDTFGEPELDLRVGRLGRVARMHEVAQAHERVVTADRALGGLVRAGPPDHRADHGDRVRSLEHRRDHRRRRDRLHEVVVEELPFVHGVVLGGHSRIDLEHAQRGDAEPSPLEARE